MTREEILNMPAGREMDSLIAKFVMKVDSSHDVYKFSTDIADAWTVVEKMNSVKMDTDEGYQVKAKFIFGIHLLHGKTEEEACLTICRAALLAVMEAE